MKAQLFSTLACLCFVFFLPLVSVSLTTTEVKLLHVFEEDDNVTTPATTTSVSVLSSLSPVTTTSTSSSTALPIQEEEDISISISISSSNISTTVGEDGKLDPQPALSTASPGSTSSLQPLKLAIEVTTKSGSVPESSHFSSTVSSQSHSQKSAYGHPSAGLDDILASSTYDASSATTVSSEHSVKSQSVTERQPSGKSQDKEDKKQKEEDKERREEATQANKRPFPLTSQSDELTTSKQALTFNTVTATTVASGPRSNQSLASSSFSTSTELADGSHAFQATTTTTTTTSASTFTSTSTASTTAVAAEAAASDAATTSLSKRGKQERKDEKDDQRLPEGEGKDEASSTFDDGFEDEEDNEETILPHRRCPDEHVIDVNWNITDAGVLALRPCPLPYAGSVYRACYSSGQWGNSDYSECRLPHLHEVQNLIFYHVHKHLVDGLYPLAEELSRLVISETVPIKSPMDRLDALDALNALLRAKIKVRIDGDGEHRDVSLVKSLIATADHLLTGIKVKFSVETEKNALITMKSAETIAGLHLLADNLLRALIVSYNEATIRRFKPINPNTANIDLAMSHRTPYDGTIQLTSTNLTSLSGDPPKVTVHLEDFKKLGIGISFVWLKSIGPELNTPKFELVSDLVLVSVLPAVSIQVDFEETPRVEIDLHLKRHLSPNDVVKCGRIKSPRDVSLWERSGCLLIARNETWLRCICQEMGAFGAVLQRYRDSGHGHKVLNHVHRLLMGASSAVGLALLLVVFTFQLLATRREEGQEKDGPLILANLAAALGFIQMVFLFGFPFLDASRPPENEYVDFDAVKRHHFYSLTQTQMCNFSALLLHYIHLASGFWMLSHSIYLYQRLWRPITSESHSQHHSSCSAMPFSESSFFSASDSSLERSGSCWQGCCNCFSVAGCRREGPTHWSLRTFVLFAWIVPMLLVAGCSYFNSTGYETHRYCWMSIEGGMVFSFIVPISLLIMTNTVVMLLVLKRFFARKPVTHKTEIEKTQPSLRAGVTLLPFFAVNWFLSVLALEDTATTVFQFIFAISNTVQCLLVFLFLFCQKQDLVYLLKSHMYFGQKRPEKSILRLKANKHKHQHQRHDRQLHPCRGMRVDFPRACLGLGVDTHTHGSANTSCASSSLLFQACSSSATGANFNSPTTFVCNAAASEQEATSNSSDSQPLLMPYSSAQSSGSSSSTSCGAFDLTQPHLSE